jgi:hypothetical protein
VSPEEITDGIEKLAGLVDAAISSFVSGGSQTKQA